MKSMNTPSKTNWASKKKKPMNKPTPGNQPRKRQKTGVPAASGTNPRGFMTARKRTRKAMNKSERRERRDYEGLM